ncbi:MAG: Na+/H+ antiporter subunit G [Lysobacterales bacterium]|jgi:multicomponent K+:H+ antiporter subunit G
MNIDSVLEYLMAALLLTGGFFAIVGSYGLFKLGSFEKRLHGPTKATTLGVGGILIASMLFHLVWSEAFSLRELLITLFLFITAPVSALMMMRAHLVQRGQRPLAPSRED